jgi:hypothetical protein
MLCCLGDRPAAAQSLSQDEDLLERAYVSDYLSFAGQDQAGWVALALDTNRGLDAGTDQAEHFVELYAQGQGWIELQGYSDYPNEGGSLLQIPESPYFSYTGSGLGISQVQSEINGLHLALEPLESRVRLGDDARILALASSRASLRWQ